jgi:centromere protein C
MVKPREAANSSWLFDKIFGDDDFIAAGQLIIPPKGRKPSKAAKDNTYVKLLSHYYYSS